MVWEEGEGFEISERVGWEEIMQGYCCACMSGRLGVVAERRLRICDADIWVCWDEDCSSVHAAKHAISEFTILLAIECICLQNAGGDGGGSSSSCVSVCMLCGHVHRHWGAQIGSSCSACIAVCMFEKAHTCSRPYTNCVLQGRTQVKELVVFGMNILYAL